jgi:predicted ATPase/DNA-binding SARP family transcriptional activator
MRQLDYRLLGPLEVVAGGEPLSLGRRQQRAVLAILLLNLNEVVSADRLVEMLWPERRPGRPLTAVQGYVSALRKLLGREAIETSGGGYVLHADPARLDSERFERLRREGVEALAAGRAARAASLLEEALSLFRGSPLADFTYEPWAQNEIGRLEELRLTALEDRVDAELALGRHAELAGKLESLVAEQPLRERRRAQLMLALYCCGRQAEALETYRSFRRLLADELGIDPSPELKELERRMLQHDAELAAAAPARLVGGTVTLLATDIEGSTRLLQRLGDAYREALAEQGRILAESVGAHGGIEVDSQGDSALIAFPRANDAVRAAGELQRRLAAAEWPNGERLRVRIGIHTGEPTLTDGRYVGLDVHRVARICAAAHGGQIVLSRETRELVDAFANELRLIDLGQHQLKDLNQPERLYQLGEGDFPPLKSLHQTNVPTPPNRLIGRERELAEIETLLRNDDVRLLTLTGPGGTGKTRLAHQVAVNLLGDFPNGVQYVPLGAITDPELVVATIAQTLGLRGDAGQPLLRVVATHVADKRLLLLLDNFEHLLAAAPTVGNLLADAPRLRVVVTSRTPLHLAAERLYPVAPLALPVTKQPSEIKSLARSESVVLFLERAQAATPDFALTIDNAATVAEICIRLDGLPLAIELAAARTPVLPPPALLQRLDNRLKLLTGGPLDAPDRQRTLRATIDWSYGLLDYKEQSVFAQLSVFAGGCTLAAAEAVCAPRAAADVFDALVSLVENNLVRQSEDASGEPRFSMLETIREFAAERLDEQGDAKDAGRKHADYFRHLSEEAAVQLFGGAEQSRWLARLEMEYDNLRAALAFLRRDPDSQLMLAAVLAPFWWLRGYGQEGRRWLEEALAASNRKTPERLRALDGAYYLAYLQGDYVRARMHLDEAVGLAREFDDRQGLANALQVLALLAFQERDDEQAARLAEESVRLCRGEHDSIYPLSLLARLAFGRGDYEHARTLVEEAIEVARAFDDEAEESTDLALLAVIHAFTGAGQDATRALRDGIRLARKHGYRRAFASHILPALAATLSLRGDAEEAALILGAARALRDELELPKSRRGFDELETRVLILVRDILQEQEVAAALEAGHALTLDQALAYIVDED